MPLIELHTSIHAPAERCFLLSLSVDLHRHSVAQTREEAVAGITKGIMKLGDTVTWRAKHFGLRLSMTSQVSVYNRPHYFVSEMVKGPFKKLHHQHVFKESGEGTLMTDLFYLEEPLGLLGTLAERSFLVSYMRRFLLMRNAYIKAVAESDEWQRYIPATA